MAKPCCPAISAALEVIHDKAHRNGFSVETPINMRTGKFGRAEVVIRAGNKFVMLNFCPFCGTALRARRREERSR